MLLEEPLICSGLMALRSWKVPAFAQTAECDPCPGDSSASEMPGLCDTFELMGVGVFTRDTSYYVTERNGAPPGTASVQTAPTPVFAPDASQRAPPPVPPLPAKTSAGNFVSTMNLVSESCSVALPRPLIHTAASRLACQTRPFDLVPPPLKMDCFRDPQTDMFHYDLYLADQHAWYSRAMPPVPPLPACEKEGFLLVNKCWKSLGDPRVPPPAPPLPRLPQRSGMVGMEM